MSKSQLVPVLCIRRVSPRKLRSRNPLLSLIADQESSKSTSLIIEPRKTNTNNSDYSSKSTTRDVVHMIRTPSDDGDQLYITSGSCSLEKSKKGTVVLKTKSKVKDVKRKSKSASRVRVKDIPGNSEHGRKERASVSRKRSLGTSKTEISEEPSTESGISRTQGVVESNPQNKKRKRGRPPKHLSVSSGTDKLPTSKQKSDILDSALYMTDAPRNFDVSTTLLGTSDTVRELEGIHTIQESCDHSTKTIKSKLTQVLPGTTEHNSQDSTSCCIAQSEDTDCLESNNDSLDPSTSQKECSKSLTASHEITEEIDASYDMEYPAPSTPQQKLARQLARQKQLEDMRKREQASSREERLLRRKRLLGHKRAADTNLIKQMSGQDDMDGASVYKKAKVSWKGESELVEIFIYSPVTDDTDTVT